MISVQPESFSFGWKFKMLFKIYKDDYYGLWKCFKENMITRVKGMCISGGMICWEMDSCFAKWATKPNFSTSEQRSMGFEE